MAWSLSLPRHKPYPSLYNDTNASSATTAEVAAIEKPSLPAPDVEEAEGLAAGVEVVAGVVVAAELPPPGCGITVPLDLPWIALPVVVAGIDPMNEPETDKPPPPDPAVAQSQTAKRRTPVSTSPSRVAETFGAPVIYLTCGGTVDDGLVGRRWASGANAALDGGVEPGFLLTLAGEVGTATTHGRRAIEEA